MDPSCTIAAHATFDANDVDWHEQQVENQLRFREKWGTDGVPPLCLLSVCLIVKDEEQTAGLLPRFRRRRGRRDRGLRHRVDRPARSRSPGPPAPVWSRATGTTRSHRPGTRPWPMPAASGSSRSMPTRPFWPTPRALRTLLADRRSEVEAYLVAIENLHGAGNARSVHTAIRLFRRAACTWRHRLHEQVVAADDPERRLRIGYLSGTRIIHRGYAAEVFEAKNKAEPQSRPGRGRASMTMTLSPAYALMNYGRALESAGRSAEAIEALREAVGHDRRPDHRRLAVKNLIYIFGRLDRFDEALDQRRGPAAHLGQPDRRRHRRRPAADLHGRRRGRASPCWPGSRMRGRDDDGMEYAAHMLAAIRGEALASLGRFGEAADVVLDAVRSDGVFEADLGELAVWLAWAQRSPVGDRRSARRRRPHPGARARPPAVAAGRRRRARGSLGPISGPARASGRRQPRWPPLARRPGAWCGPPGCANGAWSRLPAGGDGQRRGPRPQGTHPRRGGRFRELRRTGVVNGVHAARRRPRSAAALTESTAEIARLAPGLLEAPHVDAVPVAPPARPPDRLVLPRSARRRRRGATKLSAVATSPRRGGLNIVAPSRAPPPRVRWPGSVAAALAATVVSVSTTSYHADGRPGPVDWAHRGTG